MPGAISIEVSERPLVPPAVLMTFARYLEHAGMQSRGSKGVGGLLLSRASGLVGFYGRPKIPRDIDDG